MSMALLFSLFIYRPRQIQRTSGGSTRVRTGNLIFDKNIYLTGLLIVLLNVSVDDISVIVMYIGLHI